jgi:hypothetical protein
LCKDEIVRQQFVDENTRRAKAAQVYGDYGLYTTKVMMSAAQASAPVA